MTYSDKLKDPRWQKKRLEILSRDGFKCLACGDTENTLHVHHCYYVSKREPWEYPDESLLTLCAKCHKDVDEDTDSTAYRMAMAWECSVGSEMRRQLYLSNFLPYGALDGGVLRALEECWSETARDTEPSELMDALVQAATCRVITPEWVARLEAECIAKRNEGLEQFFMEMRKAVQGA